MKRFDLECKVSKHSGLSSKEAEVAVAAILDEIKGCLGRHEKFEVRGFGSFKVVHKNERMAMNPRTGAKAVVSERDVVRFKPSPTLKRAVANG